jgi:hypothetical protein
VAVVIHPHARERMEERGVTCEEVLETIGSGFISSARFGRMRYMRTYDYCGFWRGKIYQHKQIEAYCVDEESDVIVITVVVKYF